MEDEMYVGLKALIDTLADSIRIEIVTYSEDSDDPVTLYTGYPTLNVKQFSHKYGVYYVNYIEMLSDSTLFIEAY